MKVVTVDLSRDLLIVENDSYVALYAAIEFVRCAAKAIKEHASFSCALSGGSTPKKMYEELLQNKEALELDFSKVNFFWSDERAVAPNDPESNYGMAMNYFSRKPFDKAHKFRMQADSEDLNQAAVDYEKEIQEHCFQSRFDLMLLGMGEDGHTASLFPNTKALKEEVRLVCPNFVSEKNCYRLTLTYRAINEARKTLVLVTGKAKAKMLQEILYGKPDFEKYPAQKIGTAQHPALFIVDEAAAFELLHP